jgi:2'-5' RNA ligase
VYSIAALFETDPMGDWQRLSKLCDYSGLSSNIIPHFSWQTAESYQLESVRQKMTDLSASIPAFTITTAGLGVFSNDIKILFLIIVKTRKLMEIHELFWKELIPFSFDPRMHYSPENWIPHISLNLQKLEEDQFNCLLDELLKNNLNFEFLVQKMGILFLNPSTSGIDSTIHLKRVNK